MMFNVKVDSVRQYDVAERASYASPGEAEQATHQRLDARRFRPGMQVHVVRVAFQCRDNPALRPHYTVPRHQTNGGGATTTGAPQSRATLKKSKHSGRAQTVRPPQDQAATHERESGMMVISARERALLELRRFEGNYYAFMMTHSLKGKKTDTNIGYSTDPLYEIHRHNTLQTNDRTTSAAAPHWRAHMVLGPCSCLAMVLRLCGDWVNGTRGHDSKDKQGRLLSKIYNVPLYSADAPAEQSMEDFLKENAPQSYQEAYRRLTQRAL